MLNLTPGIIVFSTIVFCGIMKNWAVYNSHIEAIIQALTN